MASSLLSSPTRDAVLGATLPVRIRPLLLTSTVLLVSGCAVLPQGHTADSSDPFERYNRAAYSFNDLVDTAILKPVARAYKWLTPIVVQRGVSNVFANISDLPTAVNDLLQGKPSLAAQHVGRFAVNSTFGLLGVLDLATPMGLPRQREDFGQTLGRWGLASGPYLVLPLLGPSSVRDTFGLVVNYGLEPMAYLKDEDWRWGLTGLLVVDRRASVLEIEKTLNSIELDPYLFVRDAYLARRRNAVYDGSPPDPAPSEDPGGPPLPRGSDSPRQ